MLPYAPWLCWLIPLLGSVLSLPLRVFKFRRVEYVSIASVFTASIFAFSMIPDMFMESATDWITGTTIGPIPLDWQVEWSYSLGIKAGVLVDFLSVLMICIICFVGMLVVIFSLEYMKQTKDSFRFWFFLQLFIGGLGLIVMADNFLLLFFGWEIVGIATTALVTFWYKDSRTIHYGLKTFIILRLGDVLLLGSILILYVYSGTLNFIDLQNSVGWMSEVPKIGLITGLLLFFGATAKSAQFPLHEWLPDAMPVTPASFNAITEVLAGVYLVARAILIFREGLSTSFPELNAFFLIVLGVGAISALLGASLAMVQKNLIKILAYAIMSQYALVVVSLGIAGLTESLTTGYLGAVFHLMVDAIASGLLFLCAAAILHRVKTEDIYAMGGLREKMPTTFKFMLIGALATIGIPPLSGFWSEEAIYNGILSLAGELGNRGLTTFAFTIYGLYFIMLCTAAVTAFYIIRLIGIVFYSKPKSSPLSEKEEKSKREISLKMQIPMGLATLATITIGVLGPWILNQLYERIPTFLGERIVNVTVLDVLKQSFWTSSFLITETAIIIGGYFAYRMYIKNDVEFRDQLKNNRLVKNLHSFLWNRCYLNSLNYLISGFFRRLSDLITEYSELKGLEGLTNLGPRLVTSFSKQYRKIHTGILSHNMLGILIGVIILIVTISVMGGF